MNINNFNTYWKELGRLDNPITDNMNLEPDFKFVAEKAWIAAKAIFESNDKPEQESSCGRDGCGCE